MNPDRRDLLKVLGVLGIGGGASALYLSDDAADKSATSPSGRNRSSPTDRPPSAGQTEERTNYARAVERVDDTFQQTPTLPAAYTFDYDPVDVSFEDRALSRFVATPVGSADGDRMHVRSGTASVDALATRFRRWLGVPNDQWGEVSLVEERIPLHGGANRNRVAVVGTVEGRNLVVCARAVDEPTLTAVLDDWTLDV